MALSSESKSIFDTKAFEGLKDLRVAIVSTEWNDAIVSKLVEGCTSVLNQHSANIAWEFKVPGAVELTFACSRLMQMGELRPEAIIAFGAVIRGGTPHFEYVCDSVTQGLTSLNVRGEVPVIFGVLTLDNEAQAWERLGGPHGHKGEEAALAALKMAALNRTLNTK